MLLNSVRKFFLDISTNCGFVVFGLLFGAAGGLTDLAAAPLEETLDLRGAPISQQFLPSGASIVTTTGTRACVVSRRIGIEASVYTSIDGTPVPFDQIRRSIAASVQAVQQQAVQPQDKDQTGFRIQLKFSPAAGTPIRLTVAGQTFDLQGALEPSTDSLWISGLTATALQAAFAAGEQPLLQSTSADTAHLVTDRLDAPDLAALADCQAVLAAGGPETTPLPLSNEIRVSFTADPATAPLATLPELRTCGMTDPPGVLHLARLDSVTGFFAQTDKVFVAFDADGTLAQVYIPGILDGDFRDGGHRVRLSQAADSNLPTVQNAVKGCLGAATVPVCHYALVGGGHLLGTCIGTDGPDGGYLPDTIASYIPTEGPGDGPGDGLSGGHQGGTSGGGGFIPGGGGPGPGDTTIDGELPDGDGGGNPPPPPPLPPSPVPLPASVLMILGALLGLYGLKARRV